jgi:DNA-directed RNA polymerase subunit RPC12/RpoP
MTCEACKHYYPYKHEYEGRSYDGICRFNPPLHVSIKPNYISVKAGGWCGRCKKINKAVTKTTRFVRPTQLELKEYSVSIKFDLDCDNFLNHYDSKGWKIGTGAMKDWKAAVRTWKKKNDKPISSKACVDCKKDWHSGFKFTGLGKEKKYRCPECSEKRNK